MFARSFLNSKGEVTSRRVLNDRFIADIWTGWTISGVGDFNGNGNAGILWRDLAGHEVIWSMNGATIPRYGEVHCVRVTLS